MVDVKLVKQEEFVRKYGTINPNTNFPRRHQDNLTPEQRAHWRNSDGTPKVMGCACRICCPPVT